MVLEIYGDFLSQPSRALIVFARVNNITHGLKPVSVRAEEHKSRDFLAISPMGLVPAIDDDGFKLFESHAILRYLCATRSAPDHWYPADHRRRALLDCILDWHHLNLRQGSKTVVASKVLEKSFAVKFGQTSAKHGETILHASLKFIEDNWLVGEEPFLAGGSLPSIADLALACEVKQLDLLDRADREAILGPRAKIRKWVQATQESLAPHFAGVHSILKMRPSPLTVAPMILNESNNLPSTRGHQGWNMQSM